MQRIQIRQHLRRPFLLQHGLDFVLHILLYVEPAHNKYSVGAKNLLEGVADGICRIRHQITEKLNEKL